MKEFSTWTFLHVGLFNGVIGYWMPPEQNSHASFEKIFEQFRSSLISMMSELRHEANHHQGQDRAILKTSSEILAHLENAYSEAVWLNHKLERRILRLDD